MSAAASQRLFFALWPDDETRATLAALIHTQIRRNGHAVSVANLHITLAFLGNQSPEQRSCLETAATLVTAPSFELVIDRLGHWPRPRIFWAGPSTVPDALTTLVERLNLALAGCGYQPEPRRFQAHITLARKALRPPAQIQIPVIDWLARDFCLVESVTGERGVEYRVIGRWPLQD
jgi:2'-5' RNA ligase